MCPAATSTTMPSGSVRPSLTIVLRSEPSGFAESTRPSLRSRKKKRPELDCAAGLVVFDLELVDGIGFSRSFRGFRFAVQHLLGKAKGEAFGRMERNVRRHGQGKWIYHGIDDNGTVFVRKSFSKALSNVSWVLDADPFRTHCFGNLGEVGALEIHSEGDDARLLLFDLDEVQRIVIEDDLNHWSSSFHLRQEIPKPEHRVAPVAADGDCLPPWIG